MLHASICPHSNGHAGAGSQKYHFSLTRFLYAKVIDPLHAPYIAHSTSSYRYDHTVVMHGETASLGTAQEERERQH
jgi:hypothetical protein